MARHGALVRVQTHEELARLGELYEEVVVVRNQVLYRVGIAEVAEVGEDGHETLGFEGVAVDVEGSFGVGRVEDVIIGDLVGEEGGDDGKEAVYNLVVLDDVESDRGDSEELEGKVFDGSFGFTVNKEVSVYDGVIGVGKVASWMDES
jgi:hypothetical protein